MAQSANLTVMINAVRKAARGVQRDFGEIANLQVSVKGPGNFVTAADKRCEKVIRELLPKAPGPEVVARAIERALTARWPKVRYAVGPDSLGTAFGRRFLPDSLFLRFIRSHFKI